MSAPASCVFNAMQRECSLEGRREGGRAGLCLPFDELRTGLESSDDMRNSPSEVLVARLRELGAEVVIHDPWVPEYRGDLGEVALGCDAVVLKVADFEKGWYDCPVEGGRYAEGRCGGCLRAKDSKGV
jgi:hypothetical protein